ncbi:MAG: hypothetical protein AB7P52_04215 [Alphaproteobacteria bacterium]
MPRIASFAQHSLIQQTIVRTQERVYDRQAQISSGKQSQSFAGISKDSAQLVSVKSASLRAETYINQNNQMESRLQIADGVLSSLTDIASTLKTRLVQRLNDATGTAGVLDQDALNMLNSAVGLLNTQVAGRFLFGGSRTDLAPVAEPVPDPAVFGVPDDNYYQGDSVELTARVSETQEVQVGFAGNRQGFQELIGALKAAIEGHVTDDKSMLESALDLATSAIDNINAYRAEGGFASNAIARATATHNDFLLYADRVVSELENVDIPSAMSALAADEVALQASFSIVGRMSSISLADYLP